MRRYPPHPNIRSSTRCELVALPYIDPVARRFSMWGHRQIQGFIPSGRAGPRIGAPRRDSYPQRRSSQSYSDNTLLGTCRGLRPPAVGGGNTSALPNTGPDLREIVSAGGQTGQQSAFCAITGYQPAAGQTSRRRLFHRESSFRNQFPRFARRPSGGSPSRRM